MSSLPKVRAANLAAAPEYRPTAVFLGGTSGIGQAVAEALAQITQGNSHIIICGRNKSAADKIIANLPSHTESKYEFEPCDATLMSNVRSTTASLVAKLPKLNYLVLSPGVSFFTFKGRDETSEGIDKKLALGHYARWKFVYDLLPLLEKAKAQGEEARVLTVLAAGKNGQLNTNDLDLKQGYGIKAAADNATAMNDLMVEHFAAEHPDMAFIHAFPGFVRTPMVTGSHLWSMMLVKPVVHFFSVSPADCAQWMLYMLLDPQFSKGAFFRNSHAEDAGPNKYSTPELRKLVWEHTMRRTSGSS